MAVEDGPADVYQRQITEAGVTMDPPGRLGGGYACLLGDHHLGVVDYGLLAVVEVSGWILEGARVGTSGVRLERESGLIGADGKERHSAHHQAVGSSSRSRSALL